MLKKLLLIYSLLNLSVISMGQSIESVSITYIQNISDVEPGSIVNLPFFVQNNSANLLSLESQIITPSNWKIISSPQNINISPSEKEMILFTIQIAGDTPVGDATLKILILDSTTQDTIAAKTIHLNILEIENITIMLVQSPEHVNAGETFRATYLLQNHGNTLKNVFIETFNCDVEGNSEIEIPSGNSVEFHIYNHTSGELFDAKKEYFTVRAKLSGKVQQSIFHSFTVFPSGKQKKDLYFRYPVSVSATYLTSNQQNKLESGYQFEISGNGPLDPEGKHQLEFLARGPSFTNLSFLGLYDQYYISYTNKNFEFFGGEKAYSFTPLTETSRFGIGIESKIKLNNGLNVGFIYVKPQYFDEIQDELAGYAGFEFNQDNAVEFHYITKKDKITESNTYLTSISARFTPLKTTNVDFEISRGTFQNISDNAFRFNLNSRISIIQISGIYYFTGKNYPGYYTNSSFYSGNLSAQISKNLSIGISAREDFKNADLDTLFVTAPYTRSLLSSINYNITRKANLKLFWRDYERKDRLVFDKFHYKTNSINTQFTHKFNKIDYYLIAEFGKTSNLLLQEEQNKQTTYRGSANITYRFNSKNSVRVFGGWSNINSFVSGEQRNVTTGLSVISQVSKNLKADFHIQNAYDIDDYYRNRNLMQLNINYNFLQKHSITAHSYYTIFKQKTGDPEFTATLSYVYKFGVPLKQIIKAGEVRGRITYDNGSPATGIVLILQNKTAITNSNGEFIFPTIQPGRYLLYTDKTKFNIDQLTNIQNPTEIEVLENQESVIFFKITTGAKLTGKFSMINSESSLLQTNKDNPGNIIIELKNEYEQFRITTDFNGDFSFPLVRAGEYKFIIYPNSIPSGYQSEQNEFTINLLAGENHNLEIELKPINRNIIFKQLNTTLTPTNSINKILKNDGQNASIENENIIDSVFYSVQVGAFRNKTDNYSKFFRNKPFDFEILTNDLYKYFIGKFDNFEEADMEREKLKTEFKNSFIVIIKNGKPVIKTK